MATSAQQQSGAIQGLDRHAGPFVGTLRFSSKGEDGTTTQKEVDVFVLNSQEFIDLQTYLTAAINLPESAQRFEFECSREAFERFVPKDKELYDYLKEYLPPIQQHCFGFKSMTVGPMVNLGGAIANFSEQAAEKYGELHDNLKIVGDRKKRIEDDDVQEAIQECRAILRNIQRDATKKSDECTPIVNQLAAFKAQTEKDQTGLSSAYTRFKAAVPDKNSLGETLKKYIDETRAALDGVAEETQEARAEAEEAGRRKWYWYMPVTGVVFFIIDTVKFKATAGTMKSLKARYENSRPEGEKTQAEMLQVFHKVERLKDLVDWAAEAIDKAIEALENLQAAFSSLKTDLEKLSDRIGNIEGNFSEEYINERVVGLKDLEKAKKTWENVQELAEIFQRNGMILDIDKHPESEEIFI
ncbi:hypothetical protein FN846DRAFT_317443 [Sphaerosporella brunnea]|uniref:Uncharacterized protein n=1 Tax=Sphaerosporella brunnea TaxID=1250544 RepID=A0A5J5EM19_9PEZI|nr:hypothetical protein FN846DRAFT_317443 [Sphaerosporella brunnea]